MSSRSSSAVVMAALVLAACAGGLLLGRWAFEPRAAPAPTVAAQVQPDLAPLIAELRRSNEALLEALRSAPTQTTPSVATREPAAPETDTLSRLTAAVERLNDFLAANGGSSPSRRTTQASWRGAGYPSLDAMLDRLEQLAQPEDPDKHNRIGEELRLKHMGWSREDLFDRYGTPSRLHAGEGVLRVSFKRPDNPNDYPCVMFGTAEGVVIWGAFN